MISRHVSSEEISLRKQFDRAITVIRHLKALHCDNVNKCASDTGDNTDSREQCTLARVAQALMIGDGDCLISSIDSRRIHSTRSRVARGQRWERGFV